MLRPLVFLSGALAAGVLVGDGVSARSALLLLALAAAQLLLTLAAPERARPAALLSAALAAGAAAAGIERESYDAMPLRRWTESAPADQPVRLRGAAARDLRESAEGCSLLLDVDALAADGRERPMAGRARIEVGGEAAPPRLVEGDRVTVWARLSLPHGYGDPGVFDSAEQARRDRVHAVGYCKSRLLARREAGSDAGPVRAMAARLRAWSRERFQETVPGAAEEGLVRAMVLGDRSGIDRETAEPFRIAGTYHVLALSGAQVALVAALLSAALRRLGLALLPSSLLVCGSVAFYAVLVGGEFPVTRAAAMSIVVIAGRALGLDADLLNLIGLAAGLLIVAAPSALGDVAFQLSFGATVAIVVLARPIAERLPRLPLRAEQLIAASLAAQVALAPLLMLHFHRLAPAALILNIAAVPLSAAVLLTGFAVLIAAAAAPPLVPLCAGAAWLAARLLLLSAAVTQGHPLLDPRLPAPSALALALHAAGVVLLLDRGRFGRGLALTAAGLALTAFAGGPAADGRLQLTVLDVGQGDALVLRSPTGRLRLVDTGGGRPGRFDLGEAVVAPFLWSEGVRRIDNITLTHAHPDHVGGAPFLLRHFDVREVWEGAAPREDGGYRELDAALRGAVTRRSVGRGVAETWDQVQLTVLGPSGGPPPRRTRNDDSLVVRVGFGRVSFLLTGDIEGAAEAGLSRAPVDVVKVPHHGSRSSSTAAFVDALAPRVAIVSAGPRNPFGHPHPEVLERYLRRGALVLRTDRDGAVTVSTDGQRLWLRTFREGREVRVR
ncbi:MAG TPA: DNA internalization-related competence protein ComEC/Rec2 [Vicinamibacteria bacterium]